MRRKRLFPDFAPGYRLARFRAAQRTVVFARGANVNRVIKTPAQDVHADGMVLGEPASQNDASGFLRKQNFFRKLLHVARNVDAEFRVVLLEEKQLQPGQDYIFWLLRQKLL